jgi:hypothetical protein
MNASQAPPGPRPPPRRLWWRREACRGSACSGCLSSQAKQGPICNNAQVLWQPSLRTNKNAPRYFHLEYPGLMPCPSTFSASSYIFFIKRCVIAAVRSRQTRFWKVGWQRTPEDEAAEVAKFQVLAGVLSRRRTKFGASPDLRGSTVVCHVVGCRRAP